MFKKFLKFKSKSKGEKKEIDLYEKFEKYIKQLFRGVYIFKVRKGDVVSASVTFFALIGFFPMIFILVSIYAKLIGDTNQAYEHIINGIKVSVPHLAPWILKSIQTILSGYLANSGTYNFLNIILLALVWLEFSKSLMFGFNVLSKNEKTGGLIEDLRSLAGGVCIFFYIMLIMFLISNPQFIINYIGQYIFSDLIKVMLKFNIIQSIISLIFFSLFYKWITPVKIRLADAILGATSFVAMFVIGKTFYWVYLHYAKADLVQKFGNFYTLIVAVIWIYYLVSSFYLGISISHAYTDLRKIEKDKEKKEDKIPEIPRKA